MSISARRALLGHARGFFEEYLRGLFNWDLVRHHKPETLPAMPNGRRNPLGKYEERIVLSFGAYTLTVSSPDNDPPLGWIECKHNASGDICEGVPDQMTWENIAKFIKEKIRHG